jgi:hypothetical protein
VFGTRRLGEPVDRAVGDGAPETSALGPWLVVASFQLVQERSRCSIETSTAISLNQLQFVSSS